LDLGPAYPLKAAMVYGVVLAMALGHVHHAHPFQRFGPANQITAFRVAIVSLVAALLGEHVSGQWSIAIVAAALLVTLLDGLDGRAARQAGMTSRFGARFDMEIDALFVMILSMLAWTMGKAGAWILLAGLLRYLYIGAMWLFPRMRSPEPPSLRRKAICVVQIVGLSVITFPMFVPPVSAWICAALLLTLVYSFGVDALWHWRRRG
jgi:phosphatidylglycerophosphate synthase